MTSIAELVRRAKEGAATRHDARTAATLLGSHDPSVDRYDLLFVIGKANAWQYRRLVEGYLDSPDEPMLARMALQILCSWWRLDDVCHEQLTRFVRGVEWDLLDGGYVRLVACTAAGEYLRDHDDRALRKALLDLFDDQAADALLRESAYQALARSLGKPWREVTAVSHEDWERHVDADLVLEARRRAS